jgi:ribosome biogenesis GTPase A
MVKQPYFMSNKEWYTTNDDDELILTALAPKEAIEDYNNHKEEYAQKISKFTKEQYIEFIMSEDSWLTLPL